MGSTGFLIAAPASGSGKTTVTLAILRALARGGVPVRAAKSGPDYIDSAWAAAATGAPAVTLDAFAMTPTRLHALAAGDGLLVVEGAMGLFDGAAGGQGSAASLAKVLGLPVVLVVDASAMAQSVAPLVNGFMAHDPDLPIAGVILNRVGSPRHSALLREALGGIPVLGEMPRDPRLKRASRHLGLVQAREAQDAGSFLDKAADLADAHIDLAGLRGLARPLAAPTREPTRLSPLGQRIALADDAAFAFSYPHVLADWRAAGAEILPFSPLADEAPDGAADAVYLPGGYPELHGQALARAGTFRAGMAAAAARGAVIYGECGGFMALGRRLIDARGVAWPMCGLLDLVTSFETRRLHLGYRRLTALGGPWSGQFMAHEFHYASVVESHGPPLFEARDASGAALAPMGLIAGRVSGSFAHLIDLATDPT